MLKSFALAVALSTVVIAAEVIPPGSKIYLSTGRDDLDDLLRRVGPHGYGAGITGFDTALTKAFADKKTPVTVVADKAVADYILVKYSASEAGPPTYSSRTYVSKNGRYASTRMSEDRDVSVTARATLIHAASKAVVWSYTYERTNPGKGERSAAESIAKHLKERIEKGE